MLPVAHYPTAITARFRVVVFGVVLMHVHTVLELMLPMFVSMATRRHRVTQVKNAHAL